MFSTSNKLFTPPRLLQDGLDQNTIETAAKFAYIFTLCKKQQRYRYVFAPSRILRPHARWCRTERPPRGFKFYCLVQTAHRCTVTLTYDMYQSVAAKIEISRDVKLSAPL